MTALLEYLDLLQIQTTQNRALIRAGAYGTLMVLDHFSATGVQQCCLVTFE